VEKRTSREKVIVEEMIRSKRDKKKGVGLSLAGEVFFKMGCT